LQQIAVSVKTNNLFHRFSEGFMSNQSAKAREAMVVSQLQPNGVSSERTLAAYRAVPRENGLPEALKSVCYLDESFNLGDGTTRLEPMLHGIMVEKLEVKEGDKCLIIGDDTGYTASILSHLGGEILLQMQNGIDIIFINGAVTEIPPSLVTHLSGGGRIGAIVQPSGKSVGKITVAKRESGGSLACRYFNDAKAPYVPGYEPNPGFVF